MKKILSSLLLALAINGFAQQTSVAVLPSEGDAEVFNNDDLFALTDKLRSVALKTLPRETFTLLTQDVVVKRLGGAENYVKECRESSCIVDLGKKAMVDYVAQANIGKLRNKMRIRIEVYEVATSGLVGMYDGNGEYFDDYFSLLDAVEKNVPDIFKKIPGVVPNQASSLSKYATPTQPEPPPPPPPPPQPTPYVPPTPVYSAPPAPVQQQAPSSKPKKTYLNGVRMGPYLNSVSANDSLDLSYGFGFSVGYFRDIPIFSSLSISLGIDIAYRFLFSYSSDTTIIEDYFEYTSNAGFLEGEIALSTTGMLKLGLGPFYCATGVKIDMPFLPKIIPDDIIYLDITDYDTRSDFDIGIIVAVGWQIKMIALDLRAVYGLTDISRDIGSLNQYGLGIAFLF